MIRRYEKRVSQTFRDVLSTQESSHNYWKKQKQIKGNLTVLWLDLKNVFESIPHKLVEVALERYHFPDRISDLILDYNKTFKMRTILKGSISAWHRLERGIITGCSLSNFNHARNEPIDKICIGPVTRSEMRQPPIRSYVDDMTITTTSTIGARWVLKGIEKLVAQNEFQCI